VIFDGSTGRHVAAKTEVPIAQCTFSNDRFAARIADSELGPGALLGRAGSAANTVTWNLAYTGSAPPVFDFRLDDTKPASQRPRPWWAFPWRAYRKDDGEWRSA
jgi:hypothetical protein